MFSEYPFLCKGNHESTIYHRFSSLSLPPPLSFPSVIFSWENKNQYKSDRHSTYNCWLDVEIRMEIALRSCTHTNRHTWDHTLSWKSVEEDILHKRWQYQWFVRRMGLEFIHFIRYFLMSLKRIQIVCVTLAHNDFNDASTYVCMCVCVRGLLPQRQLSVVNKGYLTAILINSSRFVTFEIVGIWAKLN